MLLREAKEILENEGFEVYLTEIKTDGTRREALKVPSASLTLLLFADEVQGMVPNELVEGVRRALDNAEMFEASKVFTYEYIMSECISCVRHKTDNQADVKFPVLGDLEEYFRVAFHKEGGDVMSFAVTKAIAERVGIEPGELRAAGRKNLEAKARIINFMLLADELEDPYIKEVSMKEGAPRIFIASTINRVYGAGVMLLEGLRDSFLKQKGLDKVLVIPSSVHEVILVPEDYDKGFLESMIRQVNENMVQEIERLSDHCYVWELGKAMS